MEVISRLNSYFKSGLDLARQKRSETQSEYQFRRELILILSQNGFNPLPALVVSALLVDRIYLGVKYPSSLKKDLNSIEEYILNKEIDIEVSLFELLLKPLTRVLLETNFIRKKRFDPDQIRNEFKAILDQLKPYIESGSIDIEGLELKETEAGIMSGDTQQIKYWYRRLLYNLADKIGSEVDDYLYEKIPYFYE